MSLKPSPSNMSGRYVFTHLPQEKIYMRFYIYSLLAVLGLGGCFIPASTEFPPIISTPSASAIFQQADQLRYQQDYSAAVLAYEELLRQGEMSAFDSLYAINQLLYSQLIRNQLGGVEEWFDEAQTLVQRLTDIPLGLLTDHHYNQGRYFFLQNQRDSAIQVTHQALKASYLAYPKGHLKQAQTLNLLALIHRKDGNLTDSIHHYALLANDVFINNPALSPYDWENDYVQGYASLLYRAHERGEYYCRSALDKIAEFSIENNWLKARLLNLLAVMLKKRSYALVDNDPGQRRARQAAMYLTADSLFQKAIQIGKIHQDKELISLYIDWVINTCRLSDSTFFFRAMDAFEAEFSGTEDWRPYYDRLLGYYYYGKNPAKVIKHYSAFLAGKEDDPEVDYRFLADSYYCLRMMHRAQNNFEESAKYFKKSFLLYNCITEEVDIVDSASIALIDSTKRYCLTMSGFFAEGLLKKYQLEKDIEDLELANDYFDFVERHSFRTLLNRDEDAFLTFQFEAGGGIYSKALEAANVAWEASRNPEWIDKAFNYVEYLKSYLLYRDMLKSETIEGQYSINDSIRLLQGQVNQMLFSMNEELAEKDDIYHNNLVNTLNQLQFTRSQRLDTFEIELYRAKANVLAIQRDLLPGQGLVNYYNGGNNLFGIYVDSDTAQFFRLETNYIDFQKTLTDYRSSIEEEVKLDQKTYQRYLKAAASLYQALIQPFASRLTQLEQLLIIPDQLLDPIPFEALLSEHVDPNNFSFRDLPYLLHQVEIAYTSSWRVYKANQQKIQVDLSQASVGFWTTPELSSANGLELIASSIQAHFEEGHRVFNQRNGGKQLFGQKHPDFDILHLLLHARSSKADRYDNRILFGEEEGDVVYGFDLYKEKFQAKLAVLASCESAAGTSQSGEGTFSLARSFINSGIPEIVAAQFLIPQTTTGPLLSYFYKYLGGGYPTVAALHRAKIDYLQKVAKERYAYPRFWAGMMVYN